MQTLGFQTLRFRLKQALLLLTTVTYVLQPVLALANPAADQLPAGGQIVGGQANISQNGAAMNINQTTDRAAINWQSFDIGSGASVKFQQPSSSSIALNRVTGGNPSQIFGKLSANGQVFITNSAGVYFAPGSSVNVGALVATTHDISDADFIDDTNKFNRNGSTGKVVNEGSITVDIGKYVALLAPEVRNDGVIIAQIGTVALAAGESYELKFNGQGGLSDITVSKSSIASLVENKQAIEAPGGLVILSAQAANHLQGGVVKNIGTIEATGLVNDGGVIRLEASDGIELGGSIKADAKTASSGKGGKVIAIASLDNYDSSMEFTGSISAKGGDEGGNGGFVETSASNVNIDESALVDTQAVSGKTGKWLIDPYDYTINGAAATAIVNALNTSNVEVTTSADTAGYGSNGNSGSTGNITVSNAINSASLNELTLTAANAITVSAAITVGSLVLTGPGGITLNNNLTTTTAMTLNGNVTLGADITLTSGISNTYNANTTYVVPGGVTSLTATLVGGAGGQGGTDTSSGGSAGNVGSLTASFAVTGGQSIYIAPGGGGTAGANQTTNTGGGAAGTNTLLSSVNGGRGGDTGPTGNSGAGGGGGAATILSLVNAPTGSSAMLIAGGGGGGGGSGNNTSCPAQCADQTGSNYQASSMTGQAGYHSGNGGTPISDGGGSGGGGGGLLGGLSNLTVTLNEWVGRGGNVGSSGVANSFTTTSLSTSVITNSASANGYAIISYGGGAITISGTVNGAHALTISAPNSNVSITGAVGGSSALTSLAITGTQGISLAGGAVTTTGTQTYSGPLTLNANSTSFSTTNNAVTFGGSIIKGSGVNSNMTVSTGNGAVSLNGSTGTSSTSIGTIGITTTGNTNLAGAVYASSLTKSGAGSTIVSGGLVQTSGSQSYAGTLDLGGNTTLSSTGTGNITLSTNVANSNQSNLTINAASGNVTIVGNIRGTNSIPTPIGDVAVTASGTFALGTSGTPIFVEAKSLAVTAGTVTIYASTNNFTNISNASVKGVNLTTAASFNVSNASTFSGPLSGATTLTKSGAAKLTVSGINTYSGNTTVSAGILEIGGSGQLGSGNYNGNIAINGTTSQVRFNTSANNTLGGTVNGTGFLNTVGAGTTAITNQSNHNYYNLSTAYVIPISSASGSSSVYGDATTTFTYQLATTAGGGTLITDASPTGTANLSGAPTVTSNVGNYTIAYVNGLTLGNERYATVSAGNNLSWAITARPLTVTLSKIYDGSTLFSSGLALSGTVNGDATPTLSGSANVSSMNVGSYNSFASSTLSQNNSNYTLTGATIAATITKKSLNINVSKIYDGGTSYSSDFKLSGMVSGDAEPTVSGTANVASGNVGSYSSFISNALSLSNANYTLTGGSTSTTVLARALNIIVNKVYDSSSLFSKGFSLSGMVSGEVAPTVSGSANVASASAATYNSFINNSLSLSNANYTLTGGAVSATITPQPPAVSEVIPPTPVATIPKADQNSAALKLPEDNNIPTAPKNETTKVLDKPLDIVADKPADKVTEKPAEKSSSSNKNMVSTENASSTTTSGIVVSLVQEPSAQASGVISVMVPKNIAQKADGFTFALPQQIAVSNGGDSSLLTISLVGGNPLPGWIKFNPENNTFVATNVPSGGLPLRIAITVGEKKSTIVISENK